MDELEVPDSHYSLTQPMEIHRETMINVMFISTVCVCVGGGGGGGVQRSLCVCVCVGGGGGEIIGTQTIRREQGSGI